MHPRNSIALGGLTNERRDALARLNQEMFRGDLVPLPGFQATNPTTTSARFEVDPSIPGHASIKRFLDQTMPPDAGRNADPTLRLELRERSGPPPEPTNLAYAFALGCPVLSSASFRRYIAAFEPNELANLFQCPPVERRP